MPCYWCTYLLAIALRLLSSLVSEMESKVAEAEKGHAEALRQRDDEITKRGRPDRTAQFEVINSPPQTMLMLRNSSPYPAVGINVREIRHGDKVLQFANPNPVRAGVPGTWVDCWILENGIQRRNDVLALFSGMSFRGQLSPFLICGLRFQA
jgi:hypothetical protein